MLPVTAWRVDYADGSSWSSEQGPPQRTDGVLAVTWWHDPPYRTLEYGRWEDPIAVVEGVALAGTTIPNDAWEAYLTGLYTEPHALG